MEYWRKSIITVTFCLLVFAVFSFAYIENRDNPEASIGAITFKTASEVSPYFVTMLPVIYLVWRVPTKDDFNKLMDRIDRHIEDRKIHR